LISHFTVLSLSLLLLLLLLSSLLFALPQGTVLAVGCRYGVCLWTIVKKKLQPKNPREGSVIVYRDHSAWLDYLQCEITPHSFNVVSSLKRAFFFFCETDTMVMHQ
jgi:hypothetical protein